MSAMKCWCERCDLAQYGSVFRYNVCPQCGDKRCAKARVHSNCCTNNPPRGLSLNESVQKPPVGIRPRAIVRRERALEITEAMSRYTAVGKLVPAEWIEEMEDILRSIS